MYLENIFSAEDIQKQLPRESVAFIKIDKFFKDRMRKCHDAPNVIGQVTVSQSASLYQSLPRGIGALARVHHPWGVTSLGAPMCVR